MSSTRTRTLLKLESKNSAYKNDVFIIMKPKNNQTIIKKNRVIAINNRLRKVTILKFRTQPIIRRF